LIGAPDEAAPDGSQGAATPPAVAAPSIDRHPASWRDPAGFVYRRDGVLLRQVQPAWAEEWRAFAASALARRLVDTGRLLGWQDAPLTDAFDSTAAAVIAPDVVPFISYPYEWTFGQLRDAALLTLEVQAAAIKADWTLKDASAYNVAFRGVTPVLIDHLSFQRLPPESPWVAYQQFCEHFLAPLALMARRDVRMGRMLRDQLDGIPLDLAAELLPGRTRLRLGLGAHIHLHARSQRSHAGDARKPAEVHLSRSRLLALVESLRGTIEGLRWEPTGTEWADYADKGHQSYAGGTPDAKEVIVRDLLEASGPGAGRSCWDLGANTGRFSAIAAAQGYRVLSFDIDPAAAERHYRALRASGRADTTPLVMDLADPSPGVGWAGRERASLVDRADADVILALALVHHLGIGRNVPLAMVMDQFADLAPQAIVEWVPRGDPMVDVLLASREDVFTDYTTEGFEAAIDARYDVRSRTPIPGSPRVMYHLERR
jgi:SAM-dependent methyltransferase